MFSPKLGYFILSLIAAVLYTAALGLSKSPPTLDLALTPQPNPVEEIPFNQIDFPEEEIMLIEPRPEPTAPTFPVTPPTPISTPDPLGQNQSGIGGVPNRGFRQFTPNQFVDLFYQANLPGLINITTPPPITGLTETDRRFTNLAENLGYRLQAVPSVPLEISDDQELQPAAAKAWLELKLAATQNGHNLGLVSGYRPIERQRELFLERLTDQIGGPIKLQDITSGSYDPHIRAVLSHTALPGYSKHHTGYAIDITDLDSGLPFTRFGQTRVFNWISQNNYLNAKRFGFIPSYPRGADNSGPAPEEWELVYVGIENLINEL